MIGWPNPRASLQASIDVSLSSLLEPDTRIDDGARRTPTPAGEASRRPSRPYQLLAPLGRGGMAELFLARRQGPLGFSRLVALKRIRPDLASHQAFVEMFVEEARLAAQIHHANVVQVLDLGEEDGCYYIAMELIDGISVASMLDHLRERERQLPWIFAVEIAIQACQGLQAAHELRDAAGRHLGLVHRDISPSNLMLGRDGVVKVVDFGIAKATCNPTTTNPGTVKGKYPYMSPEMCRDEPVDQRTDLFALGCTLYEMLTQKRLFARDNPAATVRAICEEDVIDPRRLRPELPAQLVQVLRGALERDVDKRFASAAQMGRALREVLAERRVTPSPRMVGDFVRVECGELLVRRSRALQVAADHTDIVAAGQGGTSAETQPSAPRQGEVGAARGDDELQRRRRLRRLTALVWLAAATCIGVLVGAAFAMVLDDKAPPLRLALSPIFRRHAVRAELRPLLSYIEKRIGRRIEIVVDHDYQELRLALQRGEVDLAILPHIETVRALRSPRAPPLLAALSYRGATTYSSVFVVRDSSPARTLSDLRGKRACFANVGSASGYMVPRQALRQAGLDPERHFGAVQLSGGHVAALRDLLAGRCDVAATNRGWLRMGPRRSLATTRLRVLAVAGAIPLDHVFASPTMPPELQQTIATALLSVRARRDLDRDIFGPHFYADAFGAPDLSRFFTLLRALRAERALR
ncbi:MAG: phosphate/phosphite/phosphonate ABC transporter substrate-binding protein [Myxococcales bacterium]|nr:phosphate/phosphite/phosphonate ABC transporter substrate-binding protein [Myxococcales bacterium]